MAVDAARVKSLFLAASDLSDAAERAAYLERECGGDAELRGRVEALLRANDAAPLPVAEAGDATSGYGPDRRPPRKDLSDPTACVGSIIAGRYKLLEAIGEGGMGAVWVAEQTQPVRRKVALKLIKAGMDSKSVLARFEAERQALAVMDHPNIAKVLDGGLTETGRPFFVMEYVKGVPITEYCDATRLSVPERLNLFVQVCQAVQHAHQKGIIHRDLKPSNILVAPYDDKAVPKVIDFGLAKAMHQSLTERTLHTAHETVLGTPLYMSPEQAQLNNLDVDTRSDIYSLGVLLYELLTGTTPLEKARFKEAAWEEIKRVIREEEPPRPSARLSSTNTLPSLAAGRQIEPARLTRLVRGELDWIVMKSLEKDRTRRYETANGFALDIQRYLAGEPVLAAPPSARYRLRKFARKHRAALTTAAVIALLLAVGAAVSAWQAVRATRAESAARASEQAAVQAQQAEADRAEGERLAKLDAQAKQAEAEKQKTRAEAGEKLASERLTQVAAEKKIAQAVRDFLQDKLLAQADTRMQADALVKAGESSSGAKLNPTIRELLDRAARELAPDKIEASFPQQPLIQAEILRTIGNTYHRIGEYQSAIDFLKRSEALNGQHLGPEHPDTLICKNDLAGAYQDVGKLDLAVPLFEETLKLSKAKLGPEHPTTLTSMNNLAYAYRDAGKLDLAVPLFEETLKLKKAKLGPEHPDNLFSMGNLALAYQAAGKLGLALPLFEETLKLSRAKLGPEHPDTLISMNNLALAYQEAGKLDLALTLLEETLKVTKAKLGPDHPHTLTSMNSLATAYQAVGKLDLALPLYEETLKLRKAKLGPEHPHTLTSLNNLATAYRGAGKRDLALPLFVETLKLTKAKLGPEHPDTLTSMGNLALAYQEAGKRDLALPLFVETLKLTKAKLGPEHPDTLRSMNNLATEYQAAGKLDLALPLLEETLKVKKAKLGPEHPDTLRSMNNLATAYQAAGKLDLALPLFDETLKLMKAKLGPDHPDTLTSMHNLALAYPDAGKLDLALPLLEETLKLMKAKLGPDHPSTLANMNDLAAAYWSAKQFDKSIPLFEETLKRRAAKLGRDHSDTQMTVGDLGFNYKDADRLAEALPLLEEAYQAAKKYPVLRAFGPALLDAYGKAGENAKLANLLQEQLAEARKALPKNSPQLAGLLAQFGKIFLEQKKWSEAEPLLRECLAIREKTQPDVWSTLNTKSMLGGALLGQKKYADAEPLLLAGYEGMKKREKTIPPQGQVRIPEAIERLVQLYEATDKKDDAAKWRKELDAIKAAQKKP